MGEFRANTCIRFVPRTNERDFLSIENNKTGCWSIVGHVGGRQKINLQSPGCLIKVGTIMHELMHVCGFMHEQSRPDRDQFIEINWDNIEEGNLNLYESHCC